MYRLIVLLVGLIAAAPAWAVCPSTPGDCPSMTTNNPTIVGVVGGGATYTAPTITNGTLSGSITATGSTITNGAISGTDLGLGVVTATGATTASTFASRFAEIVDAQADYGVVCDGSTDTTATLAAAVAAAESATSSGAVKLLKLPTGICMTDPITITGQIAMEGNSSSGTVIALRTGAVTPAITIQPSGSALPAGAPYGVIDLRHLRISNQVAKTGSASAHGLSLAAGGTWTAHVTLEDVTIYGMPGDGIHGANFSGWLDCYNCSLLNNAGDGLSSNSDSDWHFYGGVIGVNAVGVQMSGDTEFVFDGTNIFSNSTSNLNLFSSAGSTTGNHSFSNVMFDRGTQVGVSYDMRGLYGAMFSHSSFILASQGGAGTYSDVLISSLANNLAVFTDSFWGGSTPTEKYDLEFAGGTNTVALNAGNAFSGGALTTNALAQVIMGTPARAKLVTTSGLTVDATTQFTGIDLRNGTNDIAFLKGFSGLNDSGVIQLLNGGSIGLQLSAAPGNAPNYINGDVYLGNADTNATPVGRTLRATDGVGTNIVGGNLSLTAGRGTGSGAGGDIIFSTAPAGSTGTTLGTAAEVMRVRTTGHIVYKGTVPAVATGAGDCGTSPAVVGNDMVGRVTVGSSTNGGVCSLTFAKTWTNAPICMVANETSGARTVFPVPTTSALVITAASTLTAADKLTYSCLGYE